ncbi:glycerol acyltransferase [Aeromicrobium sp. Root495]|uniref:lysophospholipid acyltransferase family protein n=1 Tax=Aeromicrobium sp. Root495 TaxID=1736550 RepID=UPI0006F4B644|nr:lysophospholipid acyltransferase family protein [Aeromicrobium sp. Root495]KQY58837.1 glycerol acyltransferase [Aeromicrobium sp. Root495]RYJ04365.1 MAG: 1-acyl-sn-glycerol-3-phosphate acyltransferase [Actinomycetales bacterium]
MDRRQLPRTTRWIVRFLRPIFMVTTKRDWRDVDKFPEGGFVLAPNHVSHLDPFLFSHFLVDQGIAPRFLAKDTLFNIKGIGKILRGAEQIPVYRSSQGAADSLRAAERMVLDGGVVIIYPEGTITRDPDGWPMTGRTGAVRVALATGKPLVPVVQWGPQAILWPYTKVPKVFPRKTMHMRVGDPVDLSDLADQELTEKVLHEATDRLMDRLTAMLADVRGELPSGPRLDVHTLKHRTNYKPKEL